MLTIRKSKIEFIESIASESTFLRAEEILDAKKLSKVYGEKNKTSYSVNDGSIYEVSVVDKNNGTYNISCTCEQQEDCSHKIAALLYFRSDKLNNKLEQQKKQKKRTTRARKGIDLATILNNISKEELINFVNLYSKKDKKLSTSIKTKFAHRLDVPDNKYKYKQILDSIVPPIVTREAALKKTELRQFSNALSDFTEQANDKIALTQYLDAYEIVTVVTYKWEYLKSKFDINTNDVIVNQKKIYDVWLNLRNVTIAPNLEKDIRTDLLEIIDSSFFHPVSNRYNVAEILWLFAEKDLKIRQEVLTTLHKKIKTCDSSASLSKMTAIAIKYEEVLSKESNNILVENVNIIQDLIAQLLETKAYEKSKLVTDLILKQAPNAKNIRVLEVEVLIGTKSYEQAIAKCIEYIVQFKNHTIYKSTKEQLPVEYKHMLIKEAKMNTTLKSKEYEGLFFMILFIEEEWEYMLNRLEDSFSLRSAHKYAYYLDNIDQGRHAKLYIQHLSDYLIDHLGQQASDYVYDLIDGLRNHKLYETIQDVLDFLEEKFPLRVPKF